jgi:hypothetical protein
MAEECVERSDGGGVLDGGAIAGPAGGTIRDGDYELVRYLRGATGCAGATIGETTRRAIRVFGGGTYFEWAATNRDANGTETDYWYDTTLTASGHTLTFSSWDCGASFGVKSYGYSASGDEFVYFAYFGDADGSGELQNAGTYRRTCWR